MLRKAGSRRRMSAMTAVGPTRRWTGAAVAAAATAATAAGVGVEAWCTAVEHASVVQMIVNDLPFVAFVVMGVIVVAARPENRTGWWMVAGGVCSSVGAAGVALAHHGIVAAPGSVAAPGFYAVAGQVGRTLGWTAITLVVPLLFPDGRVAGPRWRWLYRGTAVVLVTSVLDPVLDPKADLRNLGQWHNPVAPPGNWQIVSLPVFLGHIPLGVVLTVAAVVQLVQRWRHGDELRRQQLQLFAGAAALPVLAAPIALWGAGGDWLFGITATPLPIAVGVAVLAHGLYDLRTAANRTLVWLTLSGGIAALLALVIALGGLLDVDRSTPWLSWLAAGVAAVCFAPLRDVLQRGANRLTYGRWTEPYELLAALGQQLEATSDVDRLLGDVVAELRTLGLEDVRIAADDGPPGDAAPGEVALPLAAYGTRVGTLRYRVAGQPLRPRDRRLIEDLAGHLGGVLYARELTVDLQRARERLVLGREEERRRLRRDLHDGLGPALAGHLLRLDVVAGRLPPESDAAALVDALRAELRDTVNEVRRVVEGLRPPALDELGLVGALREAANRLSAGTGLAVTIDAGDVPPLPAAVEVAVYRIATEAMTNVVKHARAARCVVTIAMLPGELRLSVRDDGLGLHGDDGGGHGLRTMRERAEELRGRFAVGAATDGCGSLVEARLPVTGRPPAPVDRANAEGALL
jgi:signal transduction histidine kinase